MQKQLMNYLIEGMQSNCSNRELIGIEIEKFIKHNNSSITYNDTVKIIKSLPSNWQHIIEDGMIIGAKLNDLGAISFEPGLQIEYSSVPVDNPLKIKEYLNQYAENINPIIQKYNFNIIHYGYLDNTNLTDIDILPKPRYKFMYDHFLKTGSLGRYMMKKTASLQLHINYSTEECLSKLLTSFMFLQALYSVPLANSQASDIKSLNHKYVRTHIWENADINRYFYPKIFFQGNFRFEEYIKQLLDTPIYPIFNSDHTNIKDILLNSDDKNNILNTHINTIFTPIRVGKTIELRALDSMNFEWCHYVSALLYEVSYNSSLLNYIFDIFKQYTPDDYINFWSDITKYDYNATLGKQSVYDLLIDITKQVESSYKSDSSISNILELIKSKQTLLNTVKYLNKL